MVKQNKPIDLDVKRDFIDFIKEQKNDTVVLGCTEFPVIYKHLKDEIKKENISIYDPLDVAVLKIKEDFGL